MLYGERPSMVWRRRQVFIQGDRIVDIPGAKEETYNPFDHYDPVEGERLYLTFIAVNEDDHDQVKRFVNEYGFLGIDILKAGLMPRDRDVRRNAIRNRLMKQESEGLSDFATEVRKMRSIVALKAAVDGRDLTPLQQGIDILCQNVFGKGASEFIPEALGVGPECLGNIDVVLIVAKWLIQKEINEYLKHVSPVVDGSRDGVDFTGGWVTTNLLSAMYTMLYMDILQGKTIRKCKNETCRKFFVVYGDDTRKVYCDRKCKTAQVQREYRRRKKQKQQTPAPQGTEGI